MVKKVITSRLYRTLVVGTLTLVFLCTTEPNTVPAVLLLVPFVGIYVLVYTAALGVIQFLGPDEDENGALVRVKRPRVLAATFAGYPTLLLVLQSVVELTWWDVLIATGILLLLYVYVVRGLALMWRR